MTFLLTLLTVLKVLALVLLGLVAFVLFLVLLVLLVPIRYRLVAHLGGKDFTSSGKISWLFKVVQLEYNVSKAQNSYRLRVLFFTLFPKKPKKNKKTVVQTAKAATTGQPTAAPKQTASVTPDIAQTDDAPKEKRTGLFKKLLNLPRQAAEAVKDYEIKEIVNLSIELLKKLYRPLKPKIINISGTVGLGSPYNTGLLLGTIATLNAFLQLHLSLTGDFENSVMDVRALVAGRITLGRILWPIITFITAKPIWRLIRNR